MTTPYVPIPPAFINMLIIVERRDDESGNTACRKYQVTCNPPDITVSYPDTIVNFQLISPTPETIKFIGLDKHKPIPTMQLSNPSISLDGKLMMVCDANTVNEAISVSLLFGDGPHDLSFDPQVQNNPF